MSKTLSIKDVKVGKLNYYFTFKERDYLTIYDKNTGLYHCDCKNGSNVGCNNRQVCVHKCLAYLNVQSNRRELVRNSQEHIETKLMLKNG